MCFSTQHSPINSCVGTTGKADITGQKQVEGTTPLCGLEYLGLKADMNSSDMVQRLAGHRAMAEHTSAFPCSIWNE